MATRGKAALGSIAVVWLVACDDEASVRGVEEIVTNRDCGGCIDGPWLNGASLDSDLVGGGDLALAPDGTPDAVFDVDILGPIESLSLVPVLPDGSIYYYWHYDTIVGARPLPEPLATYWSSGGQTWTLGVVQRGTGELLNGEDGSLPLDEDGEHNLVLFANDAEIHGRGLTWRLAVERPDGTIDWSESITDGSRVRLEPLVRVWDAGDRVGVGDTALAPDGAGDIAFDLTLTGRIRSLAVYTVAEDGNFSGGEQWDTFIGATPIPSDIGSWYATGAETWTLGVFMEYDDGPYALNPDGTLIEDRNLWTHTVRVYGADPGTSAEQFAAVAELYDGSLVFAPPGSAVGACRGCDPIAQDCAQGEGCYPDETACHACMSDDSGAAGAQNDACDWWIPNTCDPGLSCVYGPDVPACAHEGCCTSYCDRSDPNADELCAELAGEGTECAPWWGELPATGLVGELGLCMRYWWG